MIEIKHISKTFGGHKVIKDFSMVFEQGKTNLLIGASGCGKTTIAKCIVGLHEVDEGSILYDGQDFSGMTFMERRDIRKHLGFLFQGSALYDSMTVEENLIFPLRMFSDLKFPEMRDRANFCLERVNLAGKNS